MVSDPEVRNLLRELCEIQREHLAEYRRVTSESLELQRAAVARQAEAGAAYGRVLIAGVILIVPLLGLLGVLLFRWGRVLFAG